MKYCPICFKRHSYIEEECSYCGTKLEYIVPRREFLKQALKKVMMNIEML